MSNEKPAGQRTVATNRKARHEYFIEDTFEAGISLTGTEIKSVRAGKVSLQEGFVMVKDGEAWLQGVPFYVDERAIVPRSFIAELLADGSIDPWLSGQTREVLDL